MYNKFDKPLMETAKVWASMSYCKKRQVGAVIAINNRIISTGYNGTLSSTEVNNDCEDTIDDGNGNLIYKTKDFVVHAEQNALMFAAKNGVAVNNGVLYTTTLPCNTCAKLIVQAGISRVVYLEEHDENGKYILQAGGVKISKYEENDDVKN